MSTKGSVQPDGPPCTVQKISNFVFFFFLLWTQEHSLNVFLSFQLHVSRGGRAPSVALWISVRGGSVGIVVGAAVGDGDAARVLQVCMPDRKLSYLLFSYLLVILFTCDLIYLSYLLVILFTCYLIYLLSYLLVCYLIYLIYI